MDLENLGASRQSETLRGGLFFAENSQKLEKMRKNGAENAPCGASEPQKFRFQAPGGVLSPGFIVKVARVKSKPLKK